MDDKKISIVIPVLNSHEVLRRQLIHFSKMDLHDVEIIIVDDGSEPPLYYDGDLPVRIVRTNDKRPWTWALARNRGAREARGDFLIMFDIDHIILEDTLEMTRRIKGDKIHFLREFGVLDENGEFKQDIDTLVKYGLPIDRHRSRGFRLTALPNNFVMRKSTYWDVIGGYREDLFHRPYPQGEDRLFKKQWLIKEREGLCMVHQNERPTIYMFPNGYFCGDVDADPKNLFHNLTRKTRRNLKHRR